MRDENEDSVLQPSQLGGVSDGFRTQYISIF